MSDVVFILGAGASKATGAPLMAEFLDVADDLVQLGLVERRRPSFDLVRRARAALQPVHSKAELDIHNLEAVFGAFEMAQLLGKLGTLAEGDVGGLSNALIDVIVCTLEETIKFTLPRNPEAAGVFPPGEYSAFTDAIKQLRQGARPPRSVSILTFNYDVAVDWALEYAHIEFHYGLVPPATSRVGLFKLHGSLNWRQCEKCRKLFTSPIGGYLNTHPWPLGMPDIRIHVGSDEPGMSCCGQRILGRPAIVPPTASKGQHHQALSDVWRSAAAELRQAEYIFVMGYSLPETDSFFRQFFGVGSVGGVPLREFWVCDPDTTGEVEKRFRRLLGPGARERFRYRQLPFGAAVAEMIKLFPRQP